MVDVMGYTVSVTVPDSQAIFEGLESKVHPPPVTKELYIGASEIPVRGGLTFQGQIGSEWLHVTLGINRGLSLPEADGLCRVLLTSAYQAVAILKWKFLRIL